MSVPVDLPEVYADSEAVNPDNNPYLSGRPRDQEFTIPRINNQDNNYG